MSTFYSMPVIRRIRGIGNEIVCLFVYFSGLYSLVSFLKRRRPVILLYHSVNLRDCPYIYPGNIVSPENFERQVAYLSRRKRTVSLSELAIYIKRGTGFPPDVVVITFDDGYYDFYSRAYRVLKRYNMPCTLFLNTSPLSTGEAKWDDMLAYLLQSTEVRSFAICIEGESKTYDLSSPQRKLSSIRNMQSLLMRMSETKRYETLSEIEHQLSQSSSASERVALSWEEVLELHKDGLVSFGSHTHNHCDLAEASPQMAGLEVSKSKEEIERHLGKPCVLFSYPFGKFKQETKEILRARGFTVAVTTILGSVSRGDDPLELKRITAKDDSSYKFKCSLIGITFDKICALFR